MHVDAAAHHVMPPATHVDDYYILHCQNYKYFLFVAHLLLLVLCFCGLAPEPNEPYVSRIKIKSIARSRLQVSGRLSDE